jgi:mono/diheme cytochrome c family protein
MLGRSLPMRNVVMAVMAVGLGAGAAVGALGAPSTSSATVKPTTIKVLAGKPSEFRFKLSKTALIKPGLVVFKVTNKGAVAHTFKICTKKSATDDANKCVGKVTKLLKKGASATLKVKLGKGSYEFLCTVAGHAALGMKGLLGVGVKPGQPATNPTPTTPATTTPAPTTPAPTTPTTTGPEPLQGDPVAGKAVFLKNGCSSCHTLAAAGANGNVGPNLDLAKPTQALVRFYVTNGGGAGGAVMPPFTLSATDLNNLAAFVYQSTHGG